MVEIKLPQDVNNLIRIYCFKQKYSKLHTVYGFPLPFDIVSKSIVKGQIFVYYQTMLKMMPWLQERVLSDHRQQFKDQILRTKWATEQILAFHWV